MTVKLNIEAVFVTEECISCGVLFAVTAEYQRNRRRDHNNFYCPSGHAQCYSGKNPEEQLKSELDKQRQLLAQEQHRREQVEADRTRWKREAEGKQVALRLTQGKLSKVRQRVGNGVRPCCNRSFTDLRRHMETKHPKFKHAEAVQP